MLIKALLVGIVVLVGLGAVAFGLFMAWMALHTLFVDASTCLQAWQSRGWQTALGTVTRALVTKGGSRPRTVSFSPKIAYAYEVDGARHTSTRIKFASSWPGFLGALDAATEVVRRHPKGSRVTVFFDPAKPQSATLDRSPPRLGIALFFVVLLLLSAAAALPIGVAIILGPMREPPPFADDELPPLHHQFGGLLIVLGVLSLAIAGIRRVRARRHHPILKRLAAAVPTRIADVQKGQVVAVFGRAEASDAGTLTAPITGESVVYHRARVLVGGATQAESVGQCEFYVADESGRLLASIEHGRDEVCPTPCPVDAAVQDFVDASFEDTPLPVPEDFAVDVRRIAPGAPVLVVGRARRNRDRNALVLAAKPDDPDSLVFAGEALPDVVRRLTRDDRRARRLAIAATVALVAGLALLLSP